MDILADDPHRGASGDDKGYYGLRVKPTRGSAQLLPSPQRLHYYLQIRERKALTQAFGAWDTVIELSKDGDTVIEVQNCLDTVGIAGFSHDFGSLHGKRASFNSHLGYGALASFNPFAGMGLNPNDPSMMQSMMQNAQFLQQMSSVMSNFAVLNQIIASNPQLAAIATQVSEVFQSEYVVLSTATPRDAC
ncbi:hypothetical protein BDR04DRAFT_1165023 [Suillus decipiens]|nr:hypothetical protein BDR04DRAFT_1165023 [Suillus decipiens]